MTTLTLKVNSGWWTFTDALKNRQAFTTPNGTLHAEPGRASHTGQLPAEYVPSARQADYVVYSYQTPIAWHTPYAGWLYPAERYSVTTTKHQGRVHTALSQLDAS
jgi:hypothetical protein